MKDTLQPKVANSWDSLCAEPLAIIRSAFEDVVAKLLSHSVAFDAEKMSRFKGTAESFKTVFTMVSGIRSKRVQLMTRICQLAYCYCDVNDPLVDSDAHKHSVLMQNLNAYWSAEATWQHFAASIKDHIFISIIIIMIMVMMMIIIIVIIFTMTIVIIIILIIIIISIIIIIILYHHRHHHHYKDDAESLSVDMEHNVEAVLTAADYMHTQQLAMVEGWVTKGLDVVKQAKSTLPQSSLMRNPRMLVDAALFKTFHEEVKAYQESRLPMQINELYSVFKSALEMGCPNNKNLGNVCDSIKQLRSMARLMITHDWVVGKCTSFVPSDPVAVAEHGKMIKETVAKKKMKFSDLPGYIQTVVDKFSEVSVPADTSSAGSAAQPPASSNPFSCK